jgi:murein DD-endopeptidase MepM/ murein hydrolase activator NlpD
LIYVDPSGHITWDEVNGEYLLDPIWSTNLGDISDWFWRLWRDWWKLNIYPYQHVGGSGGGNSNTPTDEEQTGGAHTAGNNTTTTSNTIPVWPAKGKVTSKFGNRIDPFTGAVSFHNGIDIANPVGDSVFASDDGEVISVTPSPNGTNQVIIANSDGSISGYAHVDPSVQVGQVVVAGDVIGVTDLSGRSTGGHLHYTFRPGPGLPYVDPLTHLQIPIT